MSVGLEKDSGKILGLPLWSGGLKRLSRCISHQLCLRHTGRHCRTTISASVSRPLAASAV